MIRNNIPIENNYNWCNCPQCGKKLLRINKKGAIRGVKVWCKVCKKEIDLNIEPKEPITN